jgi:outer membrane protein TolC
MILTPVIRRVGALSLRTLLRSTLLVLLLSPALHALRAQDTLTLGTLHRLAESADARAAQNQLIAAQSALRTETLRRERLPSLGLGASGTYLSDVPSLPGGAGLGPLNQQFDSYVTARATLFDPSRGARSTVEQAQVADAQAGLRSALWQQRAQVNDAFFGILLRQAQQRALEAAIADLTERRRVAQARVQGGAALASETALLDAEIARRGQLLLEALSEERALREILGSLTGRKVETTAVLALPTAEPTLPTAGRDRPEYAQYATTRELLARRDEVIGAQQLPRVALVGRSGYGRPGLNALGREFDSYYTVGLQLEWTPFNWGATAREREVQQLQTRIVETYETHFSEALARVAANERARIAALESGLISDSTIIGLRALVLSETRLRYDEGEVSAADYVLRLTESLNATLDRDTRAVRLAEARARYLTTIGREVR